MEQTTIDINNGTNQIAPNATELATLVVQLIEQEPLLTDEVVVKERFISLLLPHAINITKGKSIDNIRARINDALIKRPRRR